MNTKDNNQAVDSGWNDDDIEIDVDDMAVDFDADAGVPQASKEVPGFQSERIEKEVGLGIELDFLDTLVKDSSQQSVGSSSKDDHVAASHSSQPSAASPEKSQGYDAVGSLFSYFTSGVRSVAEQAGVKRQQATTTAPTNAVPKASNNGASSYFQQATNHQIPQKSWRDLGQNIQQKSSPQGPQPAPSETPDSSEIFGAIDWAHGAWTEVKEMDREVMEHLVRENRELKKEVNRVKKQQNKARDVNQTDENQQKSDERDEVINQLKMEIALLKNQNKKLPDSEDYKQFDPVEEFEEIKSLCALHKVDFDEEDIVKLHSACFFTKDRLQIQHQKIKLFQQVAERAIISQEILLKTTARRSKKSSATPSEAQIYMENKQLRQQNAGLRATLGQRDRELEVEVGRNKVKSQKIQHLISSLKQVQEQVGTLRNQQMMLNTFQQELKTTLQSSYLFAPLIEKIQKQARSYDTEIDKCRNAVYQKNNQINEQFMKSKQLQEDLESQMEQTKADLLKENEDQLQQIVMAKNKEIGRLFTEAKEARDRLQEVEDMGREQAEHLQILQEENDALKEQILNGREEEQSNQIALKDAEIMQLQAEIEQKNKDYEQIEEEIDQYQLQLDEKREQIQCLEETNQKLKELTFSGQGSVGNQIAAQPTPPADHSDCIQKYGNLKAEFDQLKALYDLQSIQVSKEQEEDNKKKNQTLKETPSTVFFKQLPVIPQLNLGKNNQKKDDSDQLLKEITGFQVPGPDKIDKQETPKIPENAWDDEIDLDEELLGLGNTDDNIQDIGKGLIGLESDKFNYDSNISKNNQIGPPQSKDNTVSDGKNQQSLNLQVPALNLQTSSDPKGSRKSSSAKSGLGEDDEQDFKHMRTALGTDDLNMIMQSIDDPQTESNQLEQYFKQLKSNKRKQSKKIGLELDKFLLDPHSNTEDDTIMNLQSSPASMDDVQNRERKSKLEATEEKNSISNIKVMAYQQEPDDEDKRDELDEFLLYQEDNYLPQVQIMDEDEEILQIRGGKAEEDGERGSDSQKASRKQIRIPSFSMPSSPVNRQVGAGLTSQVEVGLDNKLQKVDSGRKSRKAATGMVAAAGAKDIQSEDDYTQHKITLSDDGDIQAKDLEKYETNINQNSQTNLQATKSQEKHLHLEKLRKKNLEEVPTPQRLMKVKEIKEGLANEEKDFLKIQHDMDNDFSSSRFPESVKNPIILNDVNFNFHQDQLLLDGLASNDDSLTHQNSNGDEDLTKFLDPNSKQRFSSHQTSNSLHQRHAEIINDSEIHFDKLNSAEKPQILSSPLNQSPLNADQQHMSFKNLNVEPVPVDGANQTSQVSLRNKISNFSHKRQPFTPESKSKPFTAQIGDVQLNPAILGNHKLPVDGPEQILSDLDEDIMPDETSPQKLGQASPASKGIDSNGLVQPDIEVIEEADECEEDLDDELSKQLTEPRVSLPTSQNSKKTYSTNHENAAQESGLVLNPVEGDALESSPLNSKTNDPSTDALPFELPSLVASDQPKPPQNAANTDTSPPRTPLQQPTDHNEDSNSPKNQIKNRRSIQKKFDLQIDIDEAENGERIEFRRQAEGEEGLEGVEEEDGLRRQESGASSNVQLDLPLPGADKMKDGEEEGTENLSQNCGVTPSDDAAISRIELNENEYQNIIQYSEVQSKEAASQMSRQKSALNQGSQSTPEQRNQLHQKVVSFNLDEVSISNEQQDDQLNLIQTDITRKEKEEKAHNFTTQRQPITAREQIMNPLNKISSSGFNTGSGNYTTNLNPNNQTISSLQSMNSDEKGGDQMRQLNLNQLNNSRKVKGHSNQYHHGHSQSQQIKMDDGRNNADMQFLNVHKSPNVQRNQDFGKKQQVPGIKTIENYEHGEEGEKNVQINYALLSESLEEVDDQYKESEFYSPLKQSKIDMTSMTSSVANSTLGASPSRLQQTMNKLIQMKIKEENTNKGSFVQQESHEGMFSELEAESQLSSVAFMSPKNFESTKQNTMPNIKFPTLPKLNLEQAKLLEQELQSKDNSEAKPRGVSSIFNIKEQEQSETTAEMMQFTLMQDANQQQQLGNAPKLSERAILNQAELSALMCSVTDEAQKNQDVVSKIDMIQKEMRQQRENILSPPKEKEQKDFEKAALETVDQKEVILDDLNFKHQEESGRKEKEPAAELEIQDGTKEDDNLSLDLADLEDLNNDTFGDFNPQEKTDAPLEKHATPEKPVNDLVEALSGKKSKETVPAIPILDFLSQDIGGLGAQKKDEAAQKNPLAGLGILDDLVPNAKPTPVPPLPKDTFAGFDFPEALGSGLKAVPSDGDAQSAQNKDGAPKDCTTVQPVTTAATGGWDDEDLIDDDLLMDE